MPQLCARLGGVLRSGVVDDVARTVNIMAHRRLLFVGLSSPAVVVDVWVVRQRWSCMGLVVMVVVLHRMIWFAELAIFLDF